MNAKDIRESLDSLTPTPDPNDAISITLNHLILETLLLIHDQNEEIIKMRKENNANMERREKINKILKRNKLAQV